MTSIKLSNSSFFSNELSHLPFSSSHCVMEIIELKVHLHCKAGEKALRKSLTKIKVVVFQKVVKTVTHSHNRSMYHQIRRFTTNVDQKLKDLVSKGLFGQTLKFYKEHLHLHGNTTTSILPSIIKAASSSQFLHFGIQIHCDSIKMGSNSELVTSNSLLSMYAKCSLIESARQVFDEMLIRDTITWNSMVTSFIRYGYFFEAMEKFKEMSLLGFDLKPELVASILSVCGRTKGLRLGREIHGRIVRDENIGWSVFALTALLDMYSRCFELDLAFRVFNQIKEKNEVSWTAIIAGCTANECYDMSIEFFLAMQKEGIKPNRVTLIAVLPACAELNVLEHGKQIHGYSFRHGFQSESHFEAALIDMYCKCGSAALSPASLVFERSEGRDVVMWSSMIGKFSQSGDHEGAMKLFLQMQMEGIKPNSITLLAIIAICTAILSVDHGRGIHGYIVKSGLNSDVFVGNSLIDMYAKCGCLDASNKIFIEMPTRDCVSWSALVRAYGLHGYGREALHLFHEMQEKQIQVDGITFLAVLSACNNAGLIEEGEKLFHRVLQDNIITLTIEHYACYIDILGRSGKLEEACKIICNMPMKPSPTVWSSLISACRIHGRLDVAGTMAHHLIDMDPENSANYTLLCMVYAEVGNWHGAEEIRRVMRTRGLKKSFGYSRIEPDNRVNEVTSRL